jgi:hypothetical protein
MLQVAEFITDEAPVLGDAMLRGEVDLDKAKMFHAELAGVTDRETLRAIVDDVLGRGCDETAPMLRARVQRALARSDPESTRRRRSRDHGARCVQRKNESDGLVSLTARFGDPAVATAAYEHIDALARATKAAGDPAGRTIDQLRHDVFLDLLAGVDMGKAGYAGPADRKGVVTVHVNLETLVGIRALLSPAANEALLTGQPALCEALHGGPAPSLFEGPGCPLCRAALTQVVNEPGEIAGYGPVSAHLARETVLELASISIWRYAVDADGAVIAEGALPKDLIPEMVEQMHRWAVDASAGPDGRKHYTPSAAQIAFVRARDRRCQAPGCRVPAHRCEIDHRIPWHRGGPTFIDNLHALCTAHHRAKDEGGFGYRRMPGGLEWVSACGYRYLRSREDHRRRRHGHGRNGKKPPRRGLGRTGSGERPYWSTEYGGLELIIDEGCFRHPPIGRSTKTAGLRKPSRHGKSKHRRRW